MLLPLNRNHFQSDRHVCKTRITMHRVTVKEITQNQQKRKREGIKMIRWQKQTLKAAAMEASRHETELRRTESK